MTGVISTFALLVALLSSGGSAIGLQVACEPSQTFAVVGVPERDSVDLQSFGLIRELVLEGHQSGTRFGASVVADDFNGDGCLDLLVGEPAANHVHLMLGSQEGPGRGASTLLPYDGPSGDRFGMALAAEVVHAQEASPQLLRVWVGAPGADVAGASDAGTVVHYTVSMDLQVSVPTLLSQNTAGVPGAAENGDQFGLVLAAASAGLVVGAPFEDIGSATDAGAIWVLPAPGASPTIAGPYLVSQNSPDIPGGAEAGDRFGAALSMAVPEDRGADSTDPSVWVGVPREDLGRLRDAGMVHELRLSQTEATSRQLLTQDTPFVPGVAEPGDNFGAALHAGGGFNEEYECFVSEARIGAPGEDLGGTVDAGVVHWSFSAAAQACSLDNPHHMVHLGSRAEPGDRLGHAMGSSGSGIPGMDVGPEKDAGGVSTGGSIFTMNPPYQFTNYGAVIGIRAYDVGSTTVATNP